MLYNEIIYNNDTVKEAGVALMRQLMSGKGPQEGEGGTLRIFDRVVPPVTQKVGPVLE